MPQTLGVGDIVTARYASHYGAGIVVDYDANRTAPLHVLFDDDWDDWFAEAELAEIEVKTAA